MRTGYVWDSRYLGYDTGKHRPERPERVAKLESTKVMVDLPGIRRIAVDAHLGLPWINRVHDTNYVDEVRAAALQGRHFLDGGDTVVRNDVFDVAVQSTSGALSLVESVMSGEVDNGFAAIRPPGHHAGPSHAKGFCVFNNVAVAARYAKERYDLGGVLIIDWDVHPADGTSGIFWEDPDIHVLSLHQKGIFSAGVGTEDQVGGGVGEGATRNVPLDARTDRNVYLSTFEREINQAAARAKPGLILISCGFDAHEGDPIGSMLLKDEDFVRMTRMVKEVANRWCDGKIVSLLEGGYNVNVVDRVARAHMAELMI